MCSGLAFAQQQAPGQINKRRKQEMRRERRGKKDEEIEEVMTSTCHPDSRGAVCYLD